MKHHAIYIHKCVCVCVCVCTTRWTGPPWTTSSTISPPPSPRLPCNLKTIPTPADRRVSATRCYEDASVRFLSAPIASLVANASPASCAGGSRGLLNVRSLLLFSRDASRPPSLVTKTVFPLPGGFWQQSTVAQQENLRKGCVKENIDTDVWSTTQERPRAEPAPCTSDISSPVRRAHLQNLDADCFVLPRPRFSPGTCSFARLQQPRPDRVSSKSRELGNRLFKSDTKKRARPREGGEEESATWSTA